MENGTKVPQKIKYRAIIWSSNSTSRYISEGDEIIYQRDTCTSMFAAVFFTIVKALETI